MVKTHFNIQGLTDEKVLVQRNKFGRNTQEHRKENRLLNTVKSLAKEPMVVLLLVAATIHFISGEIGDGIFLAAAIILVAAISLYQDSRSRMALEKLQAFTQPMCTVIRNGQQQDIVSADLVVGDNLIVSEGTAIAADGAIIQSNDFSVNESILTGESLPVAKDAAQEDHLVYKGTTVASGLAIVEVTAIGDATQLGKIGKSLEDIGDEKTPLELQINHFVQRMVVIGVVVFLVVWGINYFQSRQVLDSLLKALTLAMSILPEEIPVAFTTFMAIGAWRLMRLGIVVKQMKTVETLGSATTICVDKTGTITENKMRLAKVFSVESGRIADPEKELNADEMALVEVAMWASEPIPFDAMELALHSAYANLPTPDQRPQFQMQHEYPLSGKPPMMTHVFGNAQGQRIIAAKGAPEAILAVSHPNAEVQQKVSDAIETLAAQGYRVLGVGQSFFEGESYPEKQQQLPFVFKGLVAFYDPPKANIGAVLNDFYTAGIAVKIITGDNAATTAAIAQQINFRGHEHALTGDELMQLSQDELQQKVASTNIFSRMFPDAKLRIINALKANREIVAMTGDGVNDGPALKAAHIGIAMGKKGTEIARQAASLVLLEDDLSKMVDAVAMGRRIYTNLKKAIQYIISIHIPIILTVFIPLALGWVYPNIFSPVHIIFLELIMGPTCSIVFENEPMEANTMTQPPRPFTNTFFNAKELATSIVQGLAITAGTLYAYQYAVGHGLDEAQTRTMVFTVLIAANIFLTLVNRSFYYSVVTTLRYRNNLVLLIIGGTVVLTALLLLVQPLTNFFEFAPLSKSQLLVCIVTGFVSVIWYELVKGIKRLRQPNGVQPQTSFATTR
ncbi:cation-translocating P-type ATPase [Paracnuella aquatica]|uniref:cation-translocating P-type ATPase n=1 Tax=Paracnuella aquatica TaxID=2268757 RepID=UPI000DEF9DE8|nr:cation-translocating P-type ATPase [Paracnuella aquatica]RPD50837.1 cation-translocating P-type ATPase [Paracnuella aquatica]